MAHLRPAIALERLERHAADDFGAPVHCVERDLLVAGAQQRLVEAHARRQLSEDGAVRPGLADGLDGRVVGLDVEDLRRVLDLLRLRADGEGRLRRGGAGVLLVERRESGLAADRVVETLEPLQRLVGLGAVELGLLAVVREVLALVVERPEDEAGRTA